MASMLGQPASYTAQLVAERHARFAAESAASRLRRLLRQPHPEPPCATLASQLPDVVVDLRPADVAETEPAAHR